MGIYHLDEEQIQEDIDEWRKDIGRYHMDRERIQKDTVCLEKGYGEKTHAQR